MTCNYAKSFYSCSQIGNEGLAAELAEDTEEALKEFDFLVTAEDGEGAGEARSSGDGTEWGKKSKVSPFVLILGYLKPINICRKFVK